MLMVWKIVTFDSAHTSKVSLKLILKKNIEKSTQEYTYVYNTISVKLNVAISTNFPK